MSRTAAVWVSETRRASSGSGPGGKFCSAACAASSYWMRPTARPVSTAAADIAVPAANRHPATRRRAAGRRSAVAAATAGGRIRALATPAARPGIGRFPGACRHRRCATIRRPSSPQRRMPAGRPL